MRYPEFIKDGGTIGFVAPSFGCATEPYASGYSDGNGTEESKEYYEILVR